MLLLRVAGQHGVLVRWILRLVARGEGQEAEPENGVDLQVACATQTCVS